MKRLFTFLMALLLTWIGANAQIESGDYMIVNTETEQFLYGSYNWGCRASLGSKPVFWTVTSFSNGTYTLSSQQWTGTQYLYLSGDFYCDGSSTNITLTETDSGIYTISYGGSYMYAAEGKNAGTTVTTNADQASHFKFVSLQDVIGSMEGASSANPVDVTALIDDANFKPNGNGLTATNNWTATDVTIGNYGNNATQACCAETYEKTSFSVSQTITLPSKGYYTLSAQGFYRNGSDGTGTNSITAQMFAGSDKVNLNARQTTANTMAEAWDVFLQGKEPVEPIFINAADANATASIGFSGGLTASSGDWAIFGELTLMYYGETLTYAIGEPTLAQAYAKPGSEVTITFPNCITPNYSDAEQPTLASSPTITVGGASVTATNLTYSGTTATVTFTMPSTIANGTTVTVNVPNGLIYWDVTGSDNVLSPSGEFTLTTPAIADQEGVYLYSTHADGFLSRGGEHTAAENTESYGKIATTDPYGIPVDITISDDGYATVKFLDSNLFLYAGGWAWTDGSEANAAKYVINEVTLDNDEIVYQFSYDGNDDNYLYVNDEYWDWVANNGNFTGDDNLKHDITRTYWQIFSMKERDDYKAASILADHIAIAALAGETVESEDEFEAYIEKLTGTDVTSNVTSYALAGNLSGWTETDYYTDNTNTYFSTGDWGTEIYMGDARLVQTVSGLDEGIYKVTLQGFVRQGWADTIVDEEKTDYDLSIGFLEANGYQINLKPWATEANLTTKTPDGTSNAFTDGRTYPNELYTYVGDEGKLELSINCPDILAGGWMIFKNLTLTYYEDTRETVEWTMTDAQWGTLILPFDADLSTYDSNLVAYSCSEVNSDGTLELGDGFTSLTANTPYIIGVSEEIDEDKTYKFTGTPEEATNGLTAGLLTGTFVDMTYDNFSHDGTQYLLQNHTEGEGVAFYPVVETQSANATLTPYHCYLTYSGANPVRGFISFSGSDGEATAIVAVEGAEAEGNGAIYDLSGRKVSKAVKGVYIQNGKKVLVK